MTATDVWVPVGLIITTIAWVAILRRWRLGLELYILFIPFAGAVELWLYPASWAVLIKDILFATPAYIGFAMSGELGPALAGLPRSLGTIVLLFVGLVLVQALNPDGPRLLATLVGLKVWLFYLPMILLGRAYVRDRESLLRLSRLMICLIWVPCTIGIIQWLLSLALGYQNAIRLFYGDAASAATQGFAHWDSAGLMRIPATFAFPTQYLNYILCMFVPVLGCSVIEDDRWWQRLRAVSLGLLCVAGFMTGTRGAFVMIPLMLSAFYLLRRGALGVLWVGVLMAGMIMVVLSISRIDSTGLLDMETGLTERYVGVQASEIGDALQQTWIGRGVGINTGAARFVADANAELSLLEGYYAKAVVELGIAGGVVVIAVQLTLLLLALKTRAWCSGTGLMAYSDSILALVVVILVYNYKGPYLSLDPANMLYWLFAGALFSLPKVAERQVGSQGAALTSRTNWVFEEALSGASGRVVS